MRLTIALVGILVLAAALTGQTPFPTMVGPFRCDTTVDINGTGYPACSFYDGFNTKLVEILLGGKLWVQSMLGVGKSPNYLVDAQGNGQYNAYVSVSTTNASGYTGYIVERADGAVNAGWAIQMRPGSDHLWFTQSGVDAMEYIIDGGGSRICIGCGVDDGQNRLQVGGPITISAGSQYKVGGVAGITRAITLKGSDGNNCTITVTGGIITGSTCP